MIIIYSLDVDVVDVLLIQDLKTLGAACDRIFVLLILSEGLV